MKEYIVTRHSQFTPAINVLNFYGPQEKRAGKPFLDEIWEEIQAEIYKI